MRQWGGGGKRMASKVHVYFSGSFPFGPSGPPLAFGLWLACTRFSWVTVFYGKRLSID